LQASPIHQALASVAKGFGILWMELDFNLSIANQMAKKKVRVQFRKNRQKRTRDNNLTREFKNDPSLSADIVGTERVRAKGELSRYRTIVKDQISSDSGLRRGSNNRSVDVTQCRQGTILRVQGLHNTVVADDGTRFQCQVRRILKTMSIDQRNPVAVGDRVWIRPEPDGSGWIEQIEPRHGTLMRGYRRRGHLIAANIDQILIVSGFEEPGIKPALIDRYLVAAQRGGVRPILIFNKSDLADMGQAQWVIGLYAQLGYETLATSIRTGQGVDRLRAIVQRGITAFSGQSGVGKSSLLNAIEPGLNLRVREVSTWTFKGKHTTTTAELIQLACGGMVIDTPGLRQFELWEIPPREIEGEFIEFRPWIPHCKFPDCTHRREQGCAVRLAVFDGLITECRYESYLKMVEQENEKDKDDDE
jgi:ribosome biogenesis GTPase